MSPLPDANALRAKIAEREADKAAEEARERMAAEAAQQKWIEALRNPVLPPDAEERLARRIAMAVAQGRIEFEALRFPRDLTTDNARAINQAEAGWEKTLTGLPKIAYDYWAKVLRPKGYQMRAEVVTYPGGMPGDCALILSWAE
jgi:hypothetical protein